jgi:Tol biopolymer transport system component
VKNVLLALAVVAAAQAPATQTPATRAREALRSAIVIHDLSSGTSKVVHEADGVWEAPNWSRDGRFLLVNSGGRLYRMPVDGSAPPEPLALDPTIRVNNDHDYSPDGTLLAISASSPASRQSQIYVANADGTNHRLVVAASPSYFHGWSPDGKHLAYVANRGNKRYDLYRVPVGGGEEQRLTFIPAAYDGPDYSPDGKWIYFNSDRGGGWNIWRMPAAGAGPDDAQAQRVTDDALEDWFPHPSPNGKLLLFLSFPAGTTGHDDRTARVQLRTIPMPGERIGAITPKTIVEVTGGQGTVNVNSWSPDSTRFAYVTYQVIPAR